DLDAHGRVPWWGDRGDVTLHLILIHMIAETNRHAGHADIVRELIDGDAGLRADNDNLPPVEPGWWEHYRGQLEQAAHEAAAACPALRRWPRQPRRSSSTWASAPCGSATPTASTSRPPARRSSTWWSTTSPSGRASSTHCASARA